MRKLTIAFLLLALAGCQTSDEEIRADIAGKAQEDLNFSGLEYTVKNGSVNFIGNCPSQQAFAKVKQVVKSINVIKSVSYHVAIKPVVLDTSMPLKLKTDSILAAYPQVIAEIKKDGAVTLKGPLGEEQKIKLMQELSKHRINNVTDSLTVR